MQKAKKENIKVYTVGIGQAGGAPMITHNMFGQKTYARNRDGSVAMATFNEEALRELAQIGGGEYFRASNNKRFEEVMRQINELEKREIKINSHTEYSENFMIFLIILFSLLSLFIILNNIKSVRR